MVVIDGRVAGTWQLAPGKRGGVTVQPFGPWRSGTRREIEAEVDRLAAFVDRPLSTDIGTAA